MHIKTSASFVMAVLDGNEDFSYAIILFVKIVVKLNSIN